MVAKQGKGVEKSERRRENAETAYHRLLCEESMQQVRGWFSSDTRVWLVCFLRLSDGCCTPNARAISQHPAHPAMPPKRRRRRPIGASQTENC